MAKILFVCEGNKMRSQMAEAFYNHATNSNDVISAGALGDEGTEISKRCIEAMNEVGLDISNLRSSKLTKEMVDAADKIILFPTEYMPEYALDSPKAEVWNVADPHYNREKGMDFVRQVRDDISTRVDKMIMGEADKSAPLIDT